MIRFKYCNGRAHCGDHIDILVDKSSNSVIIEYHTFISCTHTWNIVQFCNPIIVHDKYMNSCECDFKSYLELINNKLQDLIYPYNGFSYRFMSCFVCH